MSSLRSATRPLIPPFSSRFRYYSNHQRIPRKSIKGCYAVEKHIDNFLEIHLKRKTMVYGILLKAQTPDEACHSFSVERTADMNMWYVIGTFETFNDELMTMMIVNRMTKGIRIKVKGSSSSSAPLVASKKMVVAIYK